MSLRSIGYARGVFVALAFALFGAPATVLAQDATAPTQESRLLTPLYISFATLQGLDVHATTRALRGDGVEANPVMRGFAHQPTALIAAKATSATASIWLTHKLAKRSKTGAVIVMAALNSWYGFVVAHNYRTAR